MGTTNEGWLDLWSEGCNVVLTETQWFTTLELARAHGWVPAGTLMVGAGKREYSGYLPVWLQRVIVRAADARALADALDRAHQNDEESSPPVDSDPIADLCRLGDFCITTRQVNMSTMCQCDDIYEYATSPQPF